MSFWRWSLRCRVHAWSMTPSSLLNVTVEYRTTSTSDEEADKPVSLT